MLSPASRGRDRETKLSSTATQTVMKTGKKTVKKIKNFGGVSKIIISSQNYVKAGFVKSEQRYKCKNCGY
jgi:hypothetical protein